MMAKAPAATDEPLVVVVDDDPFIREALTELLRSVGFEAQGFASTRELLAAALPDRPGCMVLDVRLPGMSGLDLQAQLTAAGNDLPIIFMTGHGDIPMSVRAMKAGAVDFLTKPFRDQDMLDAVAGAIERHRADRRSRAESERAAALVATLTLREREVFDRVTAGLLNKQIAFELGISEITVKLHRGSMMRKMGASSLANLIDKARLIPKP